MKSATETMESIIRAAFIAEQREGKYEVWVGVDGSTDLLICKQFHRVIRRIQNRIPTIRWSSGETMSRPPNISGMVVKCWKTITEKLQEQAKLREQALEAVGKLSGRLI